MSPEVDAWLMVVGAFCFGVVIGWITHRTLRRNLGGVGLSDIATVIGAVAGAAITGIWQPGTGTFGAYCIGLAFGFFLYLGLASRDKAPIWLGDYEPWNERMGRRSAGSGRG